LYIWAVKNSSFVETSISILSLNEEGIGFMHFKDNSTMDIPEQLEHLNGIIKLTNNHPTPFVITAGNQVIFTKEAKENAVSLESQSPLNASAIVVSNLAYRLLADFFIRMQKPKMPYKTFTDIEKATEWCKQFLKK
jgi:hypothetical protein